jgi:hypothetical protein
MKNLILVLSIVFAGQTVCAEHAKSYWTGIGTLTDSHGDVQRCSAVDYEIHQSAKMISLRFGFLKCGQLIYNYQPTIFTIHDRYVLWNNKVAGTLEKNKLHLDYLNLHQLRIVIDARVINDTMDYQESWYDYYGNRVWNLKAKLAKKQ